MLHGLHSEAGARRQFEDKFRLAYMKAFPEKADGLYCGHLREQFRRCVEAVDDLEKTGMDIRPLMVRFKGDAEAWLEIELNGKNRAKLQHVYEQRDQLLAEALALVTELQARIAKALSPVL